MLQAVVLRGAADVLTLSPILEQLAERCDQAGAMGWLKFFLSASSFRAKKPYLVLLLKRGARFVGTDVTSLRLEEIHAAVLLFEYRILGLPTRAFCTDDWAGFRTVIAPQQERAAIAALAADALLAKGAQLVLISCGHSVDSALATPSLTQSADWASHTRPVAMTLMLEPTLRETLAKLGKSTRFNLGYYRRRLNAEMRCEFVQDARGLLQEHELELLDRQSLNPVGKDAIRLQYKSCCELPGGFLLGLRNDRGKWLSLIGGWRQGSVTVLHWQMNAAGYEKLSIGTAMRSYFLEHEVELGSRKLVYYGGTPHSLGNSFASEAVTDLVVRRRTLRAVSMHAQVRLLSMFRPLIRINSQMVQILGDHKLEWHRARSPVRETEPQRARS